MAARPKRSQAGRPPALSPEEIDAKRHSVIVARACGTPIDTIAKLLGIHIRTLERHFRRELDDGKDIIVERLNATVLRKALDGDNHMIVFYLRSHGGPAWQQNRNNSDEIGPDGHSRVPPNLVVSFLPAPERNRDDAPAEAA